VMAQDAQDDGGSYGRWRRRWAVAQDGMVAAAQDGAAMAQDSTMAVEWGSGARRRCGGGAGQWHKMARRRRRTAARGVATAARGR
jgi:hypothetical protein